uniref:Uncharacterized protein n=1 Tax=Plectus sambesii TaxID=2011161 RepID=A0A914XRA1_9BILA
MWTTVTILSVICTLASSQGVCEKACLPSLMCCYGNCIPKNFNCCTDTQGLYCGPDDRCCNGNCIPADFSCDGNSQVKTSLLRKLFLK